MGPARTGAGTQPLPVVPGLESPGVPEPREQVLPLAAPGPRSRATSPFRGHFPSRPAPRPPPPRLRPFFGAPLPALPTQSQSDPSPWCGRGNRGRSRSRACAPWPVPLGHFPSPVSISLSLPASPRPSVCQNLCRATAPPLAKPAAPGPATSPSLCPDPPATCPQASSGHSAAWCPSSLGAFLA